MTIRITHSYAEGTLLDGTTRADTARGTDARAVLDRYSWRWGRSIGVWYQRSSRDKLSSRRAIEGTADALRELGFDVEVEVDDTPRAMDEQEADRAVRMDERADALNSKASRRAGEAAGRQAAADYVFKSIPMGQPILVGHHSEKADTRRRDKAWNNLGRAVKLREEAERHAGRAETAENHMRHRYNPITVANRIEELEANIRRAERSIANGGSREHWQRWLDDWNNKLQHWKGVRAEQVAAGEVAEYGPHNVKVGDWVTGWPGGWCRVARVNKKTVTIETQQAQVTGRWLTNKLPFTHITGHRTAEELTAARASSEVAKVEAPQVNGGGS